MVFLTQTCLFQILSKYTELDQVYQIKKKKSEAKCTELDTNEPKWTALVWKIKMDRIDQAKLIWTKVDRIDQTGP